jgi:ankyrin repeat protein
VRAASVGDVETLNHLLSSGRDIDSVDDLGRTPLITAGMMGHTDVMRVLVHRGADLDLADGPSGETALGWAACFGHHDVVMLLIKAGASVNPMSDKCRCSPLMHAVANGHRATENALRAAGADLRLEPASPSR